MIRSIAFLLCLQLPALAIAQGRDLNVAIAGEPKDITVTASVEYLKLREPISKAVGAPVRVVASSNLTELARGSRTGEYDVMWVPSHLAASALKHGFEVLGFNGKMEKFVVVSRPEITSFSQLANKILYLPQEDSLAAYVGTAMLSEHDMELNKFKKVFTRAGTYEVAIFAISSGTADVTIVEEKVALDWLKANPGKGRILATSKEVPGQTVVVKKDLEPATRQKLSAWLASSTIPSMNMLSGLVPVNSTAYQYVVGLGHYTPTELSGAKKVEANEVARLLKQGAIVVDVRSGDEFRAKHIAGATSLTYKEDSVKAVTYQDRTDTFDLSKLEAGKSYIFACNGPECWKSYKASKAALNAKKFGSVYWFRGGLPEWEKSGLPIERGA